MNAEAAPHGWRRGLMPVRRDPSLKRVALEAAAADLLATGALIVGVPAIVTIETTSDLVLVRIRVGAGCVEVPLPGLLAVLVGGRGTLAGRGLLSTRTRGALLGLRMGAVGASTRQLRLATELVDEVVRDLGGKTRR